MLFSKKRIIRRCIQYSNRRIRNCPTNFTWLLLIYPSIRKCKSFSSSSFFHLSNWSHRARVLSGYWCRFLQNVPLFSLKYPRHGSHCQSPASPRSLSRHALFNNPILQDSRCTERTRSGTGTVSRQQRQQQQEQQQQAASIVVISH